MMAKMRWKLLLNQEQLEYSKTDLLLNFVGHGHLIYTKWDKIIFRREMEHVEENLNIHYCRASQLVKSLQYSQNVMMVLFIY